MQDSSTGDRPSVSGGAQSRHRLVRIEHTVTTKAKPELAWQIFVDWRYWSRISNRYEAIEWHGKPWIPGSRLRVELLRPIKAAVDRVITSREPGKSLGWINHVIGYTMEQWLFFEPLSTGGSKIFTWLEFTGPAKTIEGRSVRSIIEEYLQEWYEAFRRECDKACTHGGVI
jgi:hypothetical protein